MRSASTNVNTPFQKVLNGSDYLGKPSLVPFAKYQYLTQKVTDDHIRLSTNGNKREKSIHQMLGGWLGGSGDKLAEVESVGEQIGNEGQGGGGEMG